ncbi:Ribosomal RNA small subunit methyltransferase H [bioreactor metagenome]|jgi:16S rRNA (cytosine1402-N4)-methyltransferase|uniref:Ribosomal RNA small subunit methyltransferase H n=2 Tax=root TaxID=1 RepID=A0A562J1A8_9FIRM|nr:16S rRNA (cytosine(1402)-N(4))-methyltransferase RsmH [Sedimentibacter saalensis]MEA5096648.1 16S rRNA (cytosine(1402)-N(4))-methyltransferase RsmH [Sedimentibacter saalensis]TWH76942.1 16S rRNA (cytosine1402-N4)-methyltransferase [Sedimentibacter saalensis]
MDYIHKSVLLDESIEGLNIKTNGIYVDATLGGGGHTQEILKRAVDGKVIGIDQDDYAIERAKDKLKEFKNFIPVKNNFSNIKEVLEDLNIEKVDGIIFDLGVSSFQLDIPERGFSYNYDMPLDMRMDKNQTTTARHIVNGYEEHELSRILWEYGEEKWAARIAKFIVQEREHEFIETTGQLVSIVKKAIPKQVRQEGSHPAKRTFQAIRIEVNRELEILENTMKDAVDCLNVGGRICVITFHSLEDRIIKNAFNDLNKDCICPPEFPKCMCDHRRKLKIITRKPVLPSEEELVENRRAHSAKLRIGERV